MSPPCAWAQALLIAPGGHLWASTALQWPPLSGAGSRWQEVAKDAVSAWLSEAPSESGASLLQSAGADAGTRAKPMPVLSMGSLNTRAEPVSEPSPATICSHGRIRALPSAWLSLPVGRARCPWGSPGSAELGRTRPFPSQPRLCPGPGLPWPFSPSMAERKPFHFLHLFSALVFISGLADAKGQKWAFCPHHLAFWFGLCVILSFSMLVVFIVNPWLVCI